MSIVELESKSLSGYETTCENAEESALCAASTYYFLTKYGRIRDSLGGIIQWQPWQHLVYLLDCLRKYRFIVILKAKQIGITWLMAGANLHLALFQQGANILTLSKGEDEASESLDYSRFIHSQLPDFLRIPFGKDQSSVLTFPTMHSRLRALPSTEDAGVGFGGATRVVLDEFEYHRHAEKNFSEIYPMIERGGQLVVLSTADKLKIGTKFKSLYTATMAGDNKFYKIFYPYDVLSGRTQEWYEALDLADWEKECRYPRNESEALETLKTRKIYDEDMIQAMKRDAIKPIEHELSDKHKGLVKIFQLPVVGRRYCGFTDPSDGKEDPHASFFMDKQSGQQVASSHGKIPADQCAQIHNDLVRLYNDAFNSYELNARAGGIFSEKIKNLNTPNICAFVNTDGKLDYKKKGWWTGKKLKNDMVWGLEEAVRLGQIRISDIDFLTEIGQFMQPEGEEAQAPKGGHEDCIIATGGCWAISKYAPMGDMRVISFKYR